MTDRAASIGGRVELLAGGGELRVLVPLPREPRRRPAAARSGRHDRPARARRASARPGPGILETSIVLGLAVLLAA